MADDSCLGLIDRLITLAGLAKVLASCVDSQDLLRSSISSKFSGLNLKLDFPGFPIAIALCRSAIAMDFELFLTPTHAFCKELLSCTESFVDTALLGLS